MKLKVAIVGATGAVGRELLKVLEDRDFPVEDLVLLASERSEGQVVEWKDRELRVQKLAAGSFKGVHLALFSAGADVSKQFAPLAAAAGAVVVDTTPAFRLDADVPLVVPEVNAPELARALAPGGRRIIASPDCAALQLVVALQPLHAAATLTRVVVSTYQSVSGAGQAGVDELETQSRALFAMGEIEPKTFPHRIAFNLIPELGADTGNGYTGEEMMLVEETRKLLGLPALRASATCVRVPVFYCHSEAVTATFARDLSAEEARALLRKARGVKVVDDLKEHVYPMPLLAAGDDDTLVGRIRKDLSDERTLSLFVVTDNLRKGAATNAVQIAKVLLQDHAGAFRQA